MLIAGHGERKYCTGRRLSVPLSFNALRIELWRHEAGRLSDLTLEDTEIGILLDGQLTVSRTGNGEQQHAFGRPGTAWLCPAGTLETDIRLSAPMTECLHLFLPPSLLERTALEDHDLDPGRIDLSYAGGVNDPTIVQVAGMARTLFDRQIQTTDGLMVDGLRTVLAAHLLARYTRARRNSANPDRSLDPIRLRRVVDFIDAHMAEEIGLDDLAAQACLSPFHFSRLFRQATGLTPYRYVMERRLDSARRQLASGKASLVEVALDNGFGSQAYFNRMFRRATGQSPGQYRSSCVTTV